MRQPISVIGVVLLSVLPRLAFGQRLPPPPPPEREGSAELAFVGTSGNASTQTIGAGGEFIYRPAPWESKVKITYVRNEAEDEVKAQALLLTARAQRPIRPRLSGYGQYGYQRDRFAGILGRNAVEGGLVFNWIAEVRHKLVVDGGLGYANEHRLVGDDLSTGTAGGGGLYALKISDASQLSEDAHLVASLSDASDWRYLNVIALTVKVAAVLSLKVSNTVRYLHSPVVGFENTDAVTAVALVAKF